jgi:hypothetical protein
LLIQTSLRRFSCNPFPSRGTGEHQVAFIGHHKKEMTMDNSNGAPGATTTPADSARRIKEAASHVIDRGREAAMQRVHEGAERARSSAQNTTSALRRAAADIEPDTPLLGSGLKRAADWLEEAAGHLGQGDLNRVVDNLNTFARRNPALFLGASLAAGFLIARLGKAAIESTVDHGLPSGEYSPGLTTDGTPGL